MTRTPTVNDPTTWALDREIVLVRVLDAARDAVFAAWEKNQVIQCGYCQPGQIMAAIGLLSGNPKPTDDDINQEEAMARNVCRCATYHRIRAAIHDAAKTLEG